MVESCGYLLIFFHVGGCFVLQVEKLWGEYRQDELRDEERLLYEDSCVAMCSVVHSGGDSERSSEL